MKREIKTNAARLLDKAGVKYELISYPVDENDLSALHVARTVGVDASLLYKTIVLRGDRNGIFVCVVPGNSEVDLKKAATVSGNKSAGPIPVKDIFHTTGYIRGGGCSPIGMKKHYPTWIDSAIMEHPLVYVSAGIRGLQIGISPAALICFLGAGVADIVGRRV